MVSSHKSVSAEKKVEILRELLENRKTVSELSEQYGVHPNNIYNWKKTLFEKAVDVFSGSLEKSATHQDERIGKLQQTLAVRDNLIAEIMTDNIRLKKKLSGDL